jgi:hypothetical protein
MTNVIKPRLSSLDEPTKTYEILSRWQMVEGLKQNKKNKRLTF